jgi:MscS family membrane protein
MQAFINDLPWLHFKLAGIELWLWLILPLLFFSSYALARLLISFFLFISKALKLIKHSLLQRYVFSVTDALALLLAGILFSASQKLLPLSEKAVAKLANFNSTLYAVAIAWILIVYTNHTCELVRKRLLREGRIASSALMPMLRKIADATIFVLALLFLMQNWGFDVAALIAALGIGGIAVALASQKGMESLFGGIIISLDQPIRVGEVGKFGDVTGTVEDIGLRSTRIRTDKRTFYYIPNADMAAMRIDNLSARDKILFHKTLSLSLETTTQQISKILNAIREIFKSHAMVETSSMSVRFVNLTTVSADLEIIAYIKTNIWDDYLKVQEELLFSTMRIVEEADAKFAMLPLAVTKG